MCSLRKLVLLMFVAALMAGCQTTSKPFDVSAGDSSVLRRTGASIVNAMRIDSRVIKARDPTSLDYDPGPIKPSLHLSAASVMESTGQLDGAHDHYGKVLEEEPDNRSALIGIARLHQRAGDTESAIEAYQAAERIVGSDPVIHNDMALCLVRSERYTEAIERLRTAVSLKPDSLMYRNNLAAVLVQAQRADEAVGVLAQAHGPVVAHYNVGYMLNQQGHSAAASAHFVQALRANPSFEPARQMLDRVLPEVGQGPQQRVAERRVLPAVGSQDSRSLRRPVEHSPPRSEPETPAGATMNPRAESREDAIGSISPVGYTETVAPPTSNVGELTHADLSALPPIRRPVPNARHRAASPQSGFVAPSPATH